MTVNVERDFCTTGEVVQSVVEKEVKKISQYKKVNHSYIIDCISDAKRRREQNGSVVQSYTLGDRRIVTGGATITQEIILNIAVVSDSD